MENETGQLIENESQALKQNSVAIAVTLLTQDHEIKGLVYVSRKTKSERRLSDLLNDPRRRFLAITDAELISRHAPSAARTYPFIQIHIDKIIMIHPSDQRLAKSPLYSEEDAERFESFRSKLKGRPEPS
jgi:hypothetical protein